jgi:hypothetical protein
MPAEPVIPQIRLENITTCLNAAVATVELVSRGLKTLFLGPIVNAVCLLLTAAQVLVSHPDVMVTEPRFPDNKAEQRGMCGNARENSPAALRNHSSAYHFQYWW